MSDASQGENDFGKDAVDVGNWIHRWTSPCKSMSLRIETGKTVKSFHGWSADAILDGWNPDGRSEAHDEHEHRERPQHGNFAEPQIDGGHDLAISLSGP